MRMSEEKRLEEVKALLNRLSGEQLAEFAAHEVADRLDISGSTDDIFPFIYETQPYKEKSREELMETLALPHGWTEEDEAEFREWLNYIKSKIDFFFPVEQNREETE